METQKCSFRVSPRVGFDVDALDQFILHEQNEINMAGLAYRLVKRSIDARGRKVLVNIEIEAYASDDPPVDVVWSKDHLQDVSNRDEVVIVGAGPAGLFAALEAIESNLRPIVVERGKDVRERRRDLAAINKEHVVNPDSNYCFGEGGAGTYSDGKLYTRANKRGSVRKVLEILVAHGARNEILIDTHPHIGTNKLPKIIEAIRETIKACGGEVLFGKRVEELLIEDGACRGVKISGGETCRGKAVILATGHSARDIFHMLKKQAVRIESKPFALGLRVEHSQDVIDSIQYNCKSRGEWLPAASYSIKNTVRGKDKNYGVFSFCMCPGGFIVPSATSPGEVVVNGMSPSRRDSKFANSGIVVSVDHIDFEKYGFEGDLAALNYQAMIEQKACEVAGGSQSAPAQLVGDFVNNRTSSKLLDSSYQPGLTSVDMREVLPMEVLVALQKSFRTWGKKMKGFMSNEAQLVGVESRTSSPVKIPRGKETAEHPDLPGLYPCGEGAGYAGGIVSAAMDGQFCAQMVAIKR